VARPKSEDKRDAIIAAATKVIAAQGLSAPTALIAKEAGVSNGSLFTYFETKAELLNQLYVELKTETASASMNAVPAGKGLRQQMAQVWAGWLRWAASNPEKRQALAHLALCTDLTAQSRDQGHKVMAGLASLMDRSRKNGAMSEAPMALVSSIMMAVAETTVDFMVSDPEHAEAHSATSFEAVWRMLN
jgi:AcrR family transcriptional regulator